MEEYLKGLLTRVKSYSKELDLVEIIVDQPWVWIGEHDKHQKIIFRRTGELLMVENGQVKTGAWEIIPGMQCILLDRNMDKILFNYAFTNDSLMLLRRDGTDDITAFVNEMKLPDLDFVKYLESLSNRAHANSKTLEEDKTIFLSTHADRLDKDEKQVKNTFIVVNYLGVKFFVYVSTLSSIDRDAKTQLVYLTNNREKIFQVENNLPLPNGFYKIYDKSVYQLRKNLYFEIVNGVPIRRFGDAILDGSVNGRRTIIFRTYWKELRYSRIVYADNQESVEDGKHKYSLMCYFTVKDGIIQKQSLWS